MSAPTAAPPPSAADDAHREATEHTLWIAFRTGERARRHGDITNVQFYTDFAALETRLTGRSRYTRVAAQYRRLARERTDR